MKVEFYWPFHCLKYLDCLTLRIEWVLVLRFKWIFTEQTNTAKIALKGILETRVSNMFSDTRGTSYKKRSKKRSSLHVDFLYSRLLSFMMGLV